MHASHITVVIVVNPALDNNLLAAITVSCLQNIINTHVVCAHPC